MLKNLNLILKALQLILKMYLETYMMNSDKLEKIYHKNSIQTMDKNLKVNQTMQKVH